MNKPIALVADDEPDIRELLHMTLAKMNIDCITAGTLQQAYQQLEQKNYFLCLADMRLPDGDGIDLVKYIQLKKPELPVAVITAFGNVEGAVNTLKAGAFDYVSKPINLTMLRDLVSTALVLKQSNQEFYDHELLLGNSAVMNRLREQIQKLGRSAAPVYIHGEEGVGKELVAKSIHLQSTRRNAAFIPVNCDAIPVDLLENEFFGYTQGSFAGAMTDKIGFFQAAHGGTLYLDEVAALPLQMQVKLLRVIQEKSVKPLGAPNEIPVDVRLLSSSRKNLNHEIEQGNLRQDFYYRIKVIELRVPALREHREDIEIIAEKTVKELAQRHHVTVPRLDDLALSRLKQYSFPGNITELQNILERAMTLCEGNIIKEGDLQFPTGTPAVQPALLSQSNVDLLSYLDTQERDIILNALEKTKWNRTAAAKILGISFRALRYRLKKLGLD